MVKILANGEIVPDDDPRARSSNSTRSRNAPPQRGGIPPQSNQQQNQGGGMQQISIFQTINQRLLDLGIPRWTVGETVVEPIVTVGMLLALLLFGVQGLLFGAILFAVSQWSNSGPPEFVARLFGTQPAQGRNDGREGNRGGSGTGSDRRGRGGGSGHRLGRD